MIAEIGHFALTLALFAAVIQCVLPLAGAARGIRPWMAVAQPAALSQAALIGIAFLALVHAYVTSDFSLINVAQNSHSAKPLIYKIAGTWGNHEGSMLLWVLVLATFGAAVAVFGTRLPETFKARVLAVQGAMGIGFVLFILLTSNPFDRIFPPPADGNGLNPLLQDPALAFHPPFLYLGYVGFSVAFAFAIAALIEGRVDAAWARWVRPWSLASWILLTIGIALGSWWAYYELGWGGWWYWDPVENASFLPWLAGTALVHSAIVVEKRGALKGWTVFLAIVAFAFSLLGTFLVRSGVLTSVHAFATDPTRGVFILMLLAVVIGGSLILYAWRGPELAGGGLFQPISREGGMLLNNLLLTTGAAVVLLGTLYPLLVDAVGADKVSVGAPFFNLVFVPLMLPMVAAMAVGPFLTWKRADLPGVLGRLKIAAAVFLVTAIAVWAIRSEVSIRGLLGMGLAAWLLAATAADVANRMRLFREPLKDSFSRLFRMPRSTFGMTLAHAGLAVAIVGMTGASLWQEESIQTMNPGETVVVGDYDFTFNGAREQQGPNYVALQGEFTIRSNGNEVAHLTAEKRNYPVENRSTTEAALDVNVWRNLYAVIGDPAPNGIGYVTRFYVHPFVMWIWVGCMIMAGGGAVSLSDRRYRFGIPMLRRRRAKEAAT